MKPNLLIDGSNVLFWVGNRPQGDVPALVTRALVARRFIPAVYFDNSIFLHMQQDLIDQLATLAHVVIAPAGTPADALLLEASGQGRRQIVSNDRFRAWRTQHPALQAKWLVTGRIEKGGRASFSKKLKPAPL